MVCLLQTIFLAMSTSTSWLHTHSIFELTRCYHTTYLFYGLSYLSIQQYFEAWILLCAGIGLPFNVFWRAISGKLNKSTISLLVKTKNVHIFFLLLQFWTDYDTLLVLPLSFGWLNYISILFYIPCFVVWPIVDKFDSSDGIQLYQIRLPKILLMVPVAMWLAPAISCRIIPLPSGTNMSEPCGLGSGSGPYPI